ncbi:MAG: hypothetical protein GON13_02725 [Nanoarchaeota archaeon]|nr:hypothetical protein [Nanoarchaeota archaeon]
MRKFLFLSLVFFVSSGFAVTYSHDISSSSGLIFDQVSGSDLIPDYDYYMYDDVIPLLIKLYYVASNGSYDMFYVLDPESNNFELMFYSGGLLDPFDEGVYYYVPAQTCSMSLPPSSCTWLEWGGNYTTPSGLIVNETFYEMDLETGWFKAIYKLSKTISEPVVCGDSVCDGNETCASCVSDCACDGNYFCNDSSQTCQLSEAGVCGNDIVESGEDCDGVVSPCCSGCGFSNLVYCSNLCTCENIECIDTDSGNVKTVKGQTYLNTNVDGGYTDYCSGTTLYEYYCTGASITATTLSCDSGQSCVDGACIIVSDTCGDNVCNSSLDETCSSCVVDCGCDLGYTCSDGTCIVENNIVNNNSEIEDICGDNVCNSSLDETCGSCVLDCGCSSGYTCSSEGVCVIESDVVGDLEDACGDGVCNINENCSSCVQDCNDCVTTISNGYKIYPVESDVDYCINSRGVTYPTIGDGSANWFVWGGCSNYKIYETLQNESIKLYYYTDAYVCTNPDFEIYEFNGAFWVKKTEYNNPNQKSYSGDIYYTPKTSKIKIKTSNCFYLNIYQGVTSQENIIDGEDISLEVNPLGNVNDSLTSEDVNVTEEIVEDETMETDEVFEEDETHTLQIRAVKSEENTLQKEYSINEVKLKLAEIILKIETVQIKVNIIKNKTLNIANHYSVDTSAYMHWNFISNKLGEVNSDLTRIKLDIRNVKDIATINDLLVIKNGLIGVFENFMTVIDYIIEGESL